MLERLDEELGRECGKKRAGIIVLARESLCHGRSVFLVPKSTSNM